jgi:hypothetical protein
MRPKGHDQSRRDRRRARRPGPVIAAVHDARLAAAVTRRAGEHARAEGRRVVDDALAVIRRTEPALKTLRVACEVELRHLLLGRRVGEQVTVAAPAGVYRCRILAAERTR